MLQVILFFYTCGCFYKKYNKKISHCKEIWIYVFPEKELRCLNPNFHIHVSVSDSIYSHIRPTYFPADE